MPTTDDSSKVISIKRVLEAKMGSKARFVPKCIVDWFRKIVHEDEINAYLDESAGVTGIEWLDSTRTYLDMRIKIEGRKISRPPKTDHIPSCATTLWAGPTE